MSTITCPHAEIARSTAATYDAARRELPQLRGVRHEHPPPGTITRTIRASHASHPSADSSCDKPTTHPARTRITRPRGYTRAVTHSSPDVSGQKRVGLMACMVTVELAIPTQVSASGDGDIAGLVSCPAFRYTAASCS